MLCAVEDQNRHVCCTIAAALGPSCVPHVVMGERIAAAAATAVSAGGRHSRISPTPGRGSKVAYTLCPRMDPADEKMQVQRRTSTATKAPSNCVAIPMSSIQTNAKGE